MPTDNNTDETDDEQPTLDVNLSVPISDFHAGMVDDIEDRRDANVAAKIEEWLGEALAPDVEGSIHTLYQQLQEQDRQRQAQARRQQAATADTRAPTGGGEGVASRSVHEPQQPVQGRSAAETDGGETDDDGE